MPNIEPEVRKMPAAEAAAIDYETAVVAGRSSIVSASNAAKAFHQCLEEDIRPLEMRVNLFSLALDEENWSDAQTQVDALLAENAESPHGLTATVRLERIRTEDELDRERALELRETAKRAILSKPTYVPALIQFADLTFEHDLEVDRNAVSVIDSIRFLAPDLAQGKIFEARLFAHQGAVDEAVAMLDEMIKWSASTGQEVQLKEIRKELAESS